MTQNSSTNVIKLPTRFFIFIFLLVSSIMFYLINGWSMLLFFMTFFLVFFIFFDIGPIQENYGNESILNPKPVQKQNCNAFKDLADALMDKYNKCKNNAKPKVLCPPEFQTTINIKDYADKNNDMIQDSSFLLKKEPQYKKTVCGLIPGHAFKGIPPTKPPDLTDTELTETINNDIKLNKIQSELKNKSIVDPLDYKTQAQLQKVNKLIAELQPTIIYSLRKGQKTNDFIKNAIN